MTEFFSDSERLLRFLFYLGGSLLGVLILSITLTVLSGMFFRRLGKAPSLQKAADVLLRIHRSIRRFVILIAVVLMLGIIGGSAWLIWNDLDPVDWIWEQFHSIPTDVWWELVQNLGIVCAVLVGAKVFNRFIKRLTQHLATKATSWSVLKERPQVVDPFLNGIRKTLTNTVWLLTLIFAAVRLGLPDGLTEIITRLTFVYLIIGIGVIVIRATTVIVDICDSLSQKITANTTWNNFYQQLRPLIPLLRRCLEYALWVGVASLVLAQLTPLSDWAHHGPPLIKAIGIFFLARVAVEVANLVIDRYFLNVDNLEENERKRRLTVVPLFKTISRQILMFVGLVLMLGAFGFDPMPFLAGAGILGMVLGLGAQPLINDIVSGFFILFENTYLVGDTIRTVGDGQPAYGTVEGIDFRTTRLRDSDGNLHILRNGDLRHIINYSKEYTFAVLEVTVAYGAPIDRAIEIMTMAGSQMVDDPRVLGPLEVRGITKLGEQGSHLRAVMRVKPGEHFPISAAMRLAVINAFAENDIPLAAQRYQVADQLEEESD